MMTASFYLLIACSSDRKLSKHTLSFGPCEKLTKRKGNLAKSCPGSQRVCDSFSQVRALPPAAAQGFASMDMAAPRRENDDVV